MAEIIEGLVCGKCGVNAVKRQVTFDYMRRTFGHEVPVCPKCGKVFIAKELAEGKMAEVEVMLEDK
ncbi:MAG: DNA-binding protein [Oscillospiraceae bacterium]|nr:DNA-binding protein [Oscillospiraceae bacterium]